MPHCLQEYLRSFFCHISNLNAANSEMFWLNTFVTELLVLFHRGENSQNKQAAEEIDSFPSLKLKPGSHLGHNDITERSCKPKNTSC